MTLDQQLKRLSNGDQSAFEHIYYQTYKLVYYVALSILKERSLAEDVMQTTYLNAIKYASSYKSGTNALAWITRIARNEALNVKKKRGHEVYVDENVHQHKFGTAVTDDYGLLTDLARKVLSEEEFSVLMLVAIQGYTRVEISAILDMPVSTVAFKFNCAAEKMRKYLEENK